jgi:hypothetical protein
MCRAWLLVFVVWASRKGSCEAPRPHFELNEQCLDYNLDQNNTRPSLEHKVATNIAVLVTGFLWPVQSTRRSVYDYVEVPTRQSPGSFVNVVYSVWHNASDECEAALIRRLRLSGATVVTRPVECFVTSAHGQSLIARGLEAVARIEEANRMPCRLVMVSRTDIVHERGINLVDLQRQYTSGPPLAGQRRTVRPSGRDLEFAVLDACYHSGGGAGNGGVSVPFIATRQLAFALAERLSTDREEGAFSVLRHLCALGVRRGLPEHGSSVDAAELAAPLSPDFCPESLTWTATAATDAATLRVANVTDLVEEKRAARLPSDENFGGQSIWFTHKFGLGIQQNSTCRANAPSKLKPGGNASCKVALSTTEDGTLPLCNKDQLVRGAEDFPSKPNILLVLWKQAYRGSYAHLHALRHDLRKTAARGKSRVFLRLLDELSQATHCSQYAADIQSALARAHVARLIEPLEVGMHATVNVLLSTRRCPADGSGDSPNITRLADIYGGREGERPHRRVDVELFPAKINGESTNPVSSFAAVQKESRRHAAWAVAKRLDELGSDFYSWVIFYRHDLAPYRHALLPSTLGSLLNLPLNNVGADSGGDLLLFVPDRRVQCALAALASSACDDFNGCSKLLASRAGVPQLFTKYSIYRGPYTGPNRLRRPFSNNGTDICIDLRDSFGGPPCDGSIETQQLKQILETEQAAGSLTRPDITISTKYIQRAILAFKAHGAFSQMIELMFETGLLNTGFTNRKK